MKVGLIGHPVSHSKSPLIHDYWMARYGVRGEYNLIDTPTGTLKDTVLRLIDEGYQGFNVTVPYKEDMLPLCDWVDDSAVAIGAVNTVVIKDGHLLGYNTDAHGFIQNLKASGAMDDFTDQRALILGAGGAARAVIYGLITAGVSHIYLCNRTIEKAENLQNKFGTVIEVIDWNDKDKIKENYDLLVNTTSLGMIKKPKLKFNMKHTPKELVVNDIVYNPLETNLLKDAAAAGHRGVTGIGMLLYQAAPAFAHWTGIEAEVTQELEELVLS